MESRGIYKSSDRAKAKPYGEHLLKRNRELAAVVAGWEETVGWDDEEQFAGFKPRIAQFVEFRKELVRLGTEISPAAASEWGDNDANRSLRSQLNVDLEAFARIYGERAHVAAELGDQGRNASWYMLALGLIALTLAALGVVVMRRCVVGPLSEIAAATELIAEGKTELVIPFTERTDEIGQLARAVQHFRDATCRNLELEQLEIGTAMQRDAAMGERDKLNDKYLETKWQLSAALNNMAQGLVMINSKARILVANIKFRAMYRVAAAHHRARHHPEGHPGLSGQEGPVHRQRRRFHGCCPRAGFASGKPSVSEMTSRRRPDHPGLRAADGRRRVGCNP